MKNAIVLCSGGIDSVTTANYAKKKFGYNNLIVLFFNYNQRNLMAERKFSRRCAREIKARFMEIDLKELDKLSTSLINSSNQAKKVKRKSLKDTKKESSKFYVPCRNTIFLSFALALAESLLIKEKEKYDLFVGFKNEGKESYPDTSQKFVDEFNRISRTSTEGRFRVIAPLIKKDKEDIISLAHKLKINLKDTFSCYIGPNKHCGSCLACRLRQEGFYWANIKDPTKYKTKMNDFRLSD
jgi:7-cyano-7-deazaguanine synthase